MHPAPRRGRCRIRIFVPDAEGERLGDKPVVVCSQVVENAGAGVTEAAEEIRAEVTAAFRLADPVWIEHHPPSVTDGLTETWELVVFSAFGDPSWKPLDRTAVETLLKRQI